MAEANFWYESNGEQKGPVTAAQLKGFAVSGELRPTDMIWKEGSPDWVTAGSVKGLFPEGTPGLAPPPAPASPPLQAKSSSQGMYGPAPDLRQATAAAKEASQEAIGALKILVTDPIGGIAKAYESLGPGKALPVGIVFLVAFFICQLVVTLIGSGVPGIGIGGGFQFKAYMNELVALGAMVGTLFGMCVLVRTLSRATVSFPADTFLTGVAVLPLGAGMLIVGVLNAILRPGLFMGMLSISVWIFANALLLFLLFSGITKIYHVTERAAAIWVPLMLVAAVNVVLFLLYIMR